MKIVVPFIDDFIYQKINQIACKYILFKISYYQLILFTIYILINELKTNKLKNFKKVEL